MIHLSPGTSAVSVSFPSLLLSPLPPFLPFSLSLRFYSKLLSCNLCIIWKRLSCYILFSISFSFFCQGTQFCITPQVWPQCGDAHWWRPSHSANQWSLLLPYFLESDPTQSQYVLFSGLEDCLGQQGSSQTDILRQCQMLKPNCLYPPRYCITCSERAGAAAVISPLTLMCLNHLDREMAHSRAQAGAPLYWACFNLKTHIMRDINPSLLHVNDYSSAFAGIISWVIDL